MIPGIFMNQCSLLFYRIHSLLMPIQSKLMKMGKLLIYSKNMVMALWALMMKAVQNWRMNYANDTLRKPATFYLSIDDLPLDNWDKCNQGDFQFVRKTDGKSTDEMDFEAWTKIHDQYISEFGLGKIYLKLLNAMKKRALLECDYIIKRDRFQLTKIEMEISNIENILANAGHGGMSIDQTLIHLSKWMGTWINKKNITTREYFNLLNEYGKANQIK